MQPNKIDTVYGYLTPKRFLTTLMNPANKPKGVKSEADDLSSPANADLTNSAMTASPRRRRESYKNRQSTAEVLINRDNKGESSGADEIRDSKVAKSYMYSPMRAEPVDEQAERIGRTLNDHDNGDNISRASRVSGNTNNSALRSGNKNNLSHAYAKSQMQYINKKQEAFLNGDSSGRKNMNISQLATQDLLSKLMLVRNSLEQAISELKVLLDGTAAGLEKIDSEYERVKQAILKYTSRALDSAYCRFKKDLPNWTVYEGVEQAGVRKIQEIDKLLLSMREQQGANKISRPDIVERKIQQSKLMVEEVKQAKQQCFSQRPIISEQRIRRLEAVLKQIGQF